MNLEFTAKVLVKMVAAGCIEGSEVTFKSGFFTYILPKWVHYYHLMFLLKTDRQWQEAYLKIVEEMFDTKI